MSETSNECHWWVWPSSQSARKLLYYDVCANVPHFVYLRTYWKRNIFTACFVCAKRFPTMTQIAADFSVLRVYVLLMVADKCVWVCCWLGKRHIRNKNSELEPAKKPSYTVHTQTSKNSQTKLLKKFSSSNFSACQKFRFSGRKKTDQIRNKRFHWMQKRVPCSFSLEKSAIVKIERIE